MEFFAAVGKLFITIILLVFSSVLVGYIAFHFWNWFVIPLGAPAIGVVNAIGVVMILRLITRQPVTKDEAGRPYSETLSRGIVTTVGSLIFWGLGFLVHLFL